MPNSSDITGFEGLERDLQRISNPIRVEYDFFAPLEGDQCKLRLLEYHGPVQRRFQGTSVQKFRFIIIVYCSETQHWHGPLTWDSNQSVFLTLSDRLISRHPEQEEFNVKRVGSGIETRYGISDGYGAPFRFRLSQRLPAVYEYDMEDIEEDTACEAYHDVPNPSGPNGLSDFGRSIRRRRYASSQVDMAQAVESTVYTSSCSPPSSSPPSPRTTIEEEFFSRQQQEQTSL